MTEEKYKPLSDRLIDMLITEERDFADRNYGPYSSPHEGWSVIRKKFIDACDELRIINDNVDRLDGDVRHDGVPDAQKSNAVRIQDAAVDLVREAIQIAATARRYEAMCQRMIDEQEKANDKEGTA